MTEPPPRGSDAISPTAHYTGYVWARNGLSTPELETAVGRLSFASMQPAAALSRLLGGPTLEQFLLARHRLIDHVLEEAIAAGRVSQVLEIAAGMSPRGWRFAGRHGDAVTYVEADLPAMAARKRAALERAGSLSDHTGWWRSTRSPTTEHSASAPWQASSTRPAGLRSSRRG